MWTAAVNLDEWVPWIEARLIPVTIALVVGLEGAEAPDAPRSRGARGHGAQALAALPFASLCQRCQRERETGGWLAGPFEEAVATHSRAI